jgi:hypothetical protein
MLHSRSEPLERVVRDGESGMHIHQAYRISNNIPCALPLLSSLIFIC